VTGASCQVAQPVLYLVHSPAGGFPAPSGRGLPADRRGTQVGPGSFFWHCGQDAFLSGRAWFGACLHVGAVFGVIRCAWHGFMHGRPGTARVAGARARGQVGQQKPGCQAPVIFSRPPPRGRASPHIQLTSRRAPACRRPPASGCDWHFCRPAQFGRHLRGSPGSGLPASFGRSFPADRRAQLSSRGVLVRRFQGGCCSGVGVVGGSCCRCRAGSVIRSVAWHGFLHGRRWHGPGCICGKASCQTGLSKSHGAKLPPATPPSHQ
jgi:hypothetical protein